jgi:hypothetical protein
MSKSSSPAKTTHNLKNKIKLYLHVVCDMDNYIKNKKEKDSVLQIDNILRFQIDEIIESKKLEELVKINNLEKLKERKAMNDSPEKEVKSLTKTVSEPFFTFISCKKSSNVTCFSQKGLNTPNTFFNTKKECIITGNKIENKMKKVNIFFIKGNYYQTL